MAGPETEDITLDFTEKKTEICYTGFNPHLYTLSDLHALNPKTNLEDFRQQFIQSHRASGENTMLSPEYRRKKYAMFLLRSFCLAALYFLLWDIAWVRWTLLLTLPVTGFYFFSLVGWRYFLERKLQRMREEVS